MPEFMNGVRVPSPTTLRRYGLTRGEWEAKAEEQDWLCAGGHPPPKSGILHIDHEHVRGWKNMPPEQRKLYVRGLACWRCNAVFLRRGATPTLLRKLADFLERYLTRKEGSGTLE